MSSSEASEPGPFLELLGHVAYAYTIARPMLPTYIHMIASAVFPIYTASHAALSIPSSAAKKEKKQHRTGQSKSYESDSSEDSEDEEKPGLFQMEKFTPSDAIVLPIFSGITLAGLYYLIQWLQDPAILNKILNIYFSYMGVFMGIKFANDALRVLRSLIFPAQYSRHGYIWRIYQKNSFRPVTDEDVAELENEGLYKTNYSPLPGALASIKLPKRLQSFLWSVRDSSHKKATLRFHFQPLFSFKTQIDCIDVLSCTAVPLAMLYYNFVFNSWWLTNFMAFSFSYQAIQYMVPSTFWTGTLILSALFCYDIYMVFFTPLMVTVATKLEVPIKLVFPRPSDTADPSTPSYAMLGLGDVVLPGMMIAFALRFDLWLYYEKKRQITSTKAPYQTVSGGWGEWFWTNRKSLRLRLVKLFPAYSNAKTFPKPYFQASLFGFVLGLIVTIVVMNIANHAQPALLYLVPGVLLSLWGTALVRGEVKTMWNYVDSDIEEDKKPEEMKDKASATEPAEKEAQSKKESQDPPKEASRELFVLSLTLPQSKIRRNDVAKETIANVVSAVESIQPEEQERPIERALGADGEPISKRARK